MPTHDLATVEGILSALSINPAWSPDRREEAINLECAKHNALVEIADALNCASPSSIARAREIVSAVWALKHKSPEVAAVEQHDGGVVEELKAKIASNVAEAAARDMRIAELEWTIEATHKVFDDVGVAWSVGDDAGRLPLPKRAEYAASPGFLADAERKALEARIADLERDLAAKDDALAQICEIVGAPAGVSPDAVVDGARMLRSTAQHAKVRATQAEATLKEINLALLDAGAPQAYTDDGEKHPIPPAERVLLLGERARAEHAERILEGDRADLYRQRLADVDLALDKRGASRLADDAPLPTAARLRSLTL